MEKLKHDPVNRDMRARLEQNRHGKLTADQWKEMVIEPLVTLMVLMIPAVVVMGPRLAMFVRGGTLYIVLLLVGILILSMILRAIRYARAPLHSARLYAADDIRPFWMFWKADVLYNESDKAVKFHKWLTPRTRLRPGQTYLVYYLKDAERNVLLSFAPADHEDTAKWTPSSVFEGRLHRRGGGQR